MKGIAHIYYQNGMNTLTKSIAEPVLAHFSGQISSGVAGAIHQASARTGVDFAYLLQQAKAESSFDPKAKAKTSSASGLYQFIESTWLSMVEKHGDKYGIETEGKTRKELLDYRFDAVKASAMAAELARENKRSLEVNWGGDIGSTELYLAHFLGAGQAAAFLNARDENGMREAADLFPAAANANRAVFYDNASGRERSLDEVYAFFDRKFSIEDASLPQDITLKDSKAVRRPAPQQAEARSFVFEKNRPALSYQDLIAQPLELLLLTQTMDLPLSNRGREFQLFSTRQIF